MGAVRLRRTDAEIEAIKDAMLRVAEEDQPVTVRQLFYRLVSEGAIEKTEAEYDKVASYCGQLRRDGRMPYEWINDPSRMIRQRPTWDGPGDLIRWARDAYMRDIWQTQKHRIQIWVEKDALVGIFEQVTRRFAVPLFSSKGYSSLTLLKDAADQIIVDNDAGRDTYVYQFGDFDASGADIPRAISEGLAELGADHYFERVAITQSQITELSLPTRPQKGSDSRAKNFGDEAVELDAIPPATLREMITTTIEGRLDAETWSAGIAQQEKDLEDLNAVADSFEKLLKRVKRR